MNDRFFENTASALFAGVCYVGLQLWLIKLLIATFGTPETGPSKIVYVAVVTALSVAPVVVSSWHLPKGWRLAPAFVAAASIFGYLYIFELGQNAAGLRHGLALLIWIMSDPSSLTILLLRIGVPLAAVSALHRLNDQKQKRAG